MNQKMILLAIAFTLFRMTASAQTEQLTMSNTRSVDVSNYPVVVSLDGKSARSAVVKDGSTILPCQLDDFNGDGRYDELFFLTDLKAKEKKTFNITYSDRDAATAFEPQVYVELMLTNKKVKETNKQDLYISHLTVDEGVNPYWMLHHHGTAFENKLVAYRIYFDHRQTVDIYGKYHQGLELKDTQFYPDDAQKAAGYGDDVLWVGSTLGLGTLRGWDGTKPVMLEKVRHCTQRIVSRGPLRTIVEVKDEGWQPSEGMSLVDMTQRFTLMAGRRDCRVDISIDGATDGLQLCTGIINVKNSVEYSDHAGLRGCWGTDWPVSAKDSVGHQRETVGLGICVPRELIVSELPANKDNYAYVINAVPRFTYYITFCSDNEDFGYHSADAWFDYLRALKKEY